MTTSTPSSSSKSSSRSFVSMTGLLVSVLCAAAVAGGLATLVLQQRLTVVETKLTELTATVAMLTTLTTGTDTGADTVSSSSNRRRLERDYLANLRDPVQSSFPNGIEYLFSLEEDSDFNPNSISSSFKERFMYELFQQYLRFMAPSTVLDNSMAENEEDATPLPENNLVCTPFRAWVLAVIICNPPTVGCYIVDSNRTVEIYNAVGKTEKYTMYKPTAQNIKLCNNDGIVCPIPTEELGIYAGTLVEDAAGPILRSDDLYSYSYWGDYMVLLDPVRIEGGFGPLTQYRSSFAYTKYIYETGEDNNPDDYGSGANQRVPEYPITGMDAWDWIKQACGCVHCNRERLASEQVYILFKDELLACHS